MYNLKNYEKLIRIVFGQVPFTNEKNKIEGDLLIMQYLGIVFASTKENGFQTLEDSIKKLNKLEEYFINHNLFPFVTKLEHQKDDNIWNTTTGNSNNNWQQYLEGKEPEGEKVEEFGDSYIKKLDPYDLYTFNIEKTQKAFAKLIKILPLLGEKSCKNTTEESKFNIKNYCY